LPEACVELLLQPAKTVRIEMPSTDAETMRGRAMVMTTP
jgi:hypothetical protein